MLTGKFLLGEFGEKAKKEFIDYKINIFQNFAKKKKKRQLSGKLLRYKAYLNTWGSISAIAHSVSGYS